MKSERERRPRVSEREETKRKSVRAREIRDLEKEEIERVSRSRQQDNKRLESESERPIYVCNVLFW